MLAGIRKRLTRKHFEIKECEDEDKDELHSACVPPPNYIKISQGKIQLVHQSKSLESDVVSQAHVLKQGGKSQCGSPTFEKELRDQLENMQRVMKSKERKTMQSCRDHKVLQTRFARQESLLQTMQLENKNLIMRIRQYEHCLDDVMRKVVDAIVAEDNLREEVAMLKSRVRDLEEQNAALSASPAKGRDEGYCTMSSGQPQPSNGHLEDLPEEPEQWLLPAEPCSTEMEDWSMSQEELAVITLDDERDHQQHQQHMRQRGRRNGEHDWIWNSNDFLNSTMVETDSMSDGISQLLQQKIIYSEDEEVACTEFTNDFYKLVNIRGSGSTRSLYSYIEGETDDEDDDEDDEDDSSLSEDNDRLRCRSKLNGPQASSPTPSEAGRAQVTSCSSSESDEISHCTTHQELPEEEELGEACAGDHSDIEIEDVQLDTVQGKTLSETQCIKDIIKTELRRHPLVKSKSVLEEQEPSCILRNNQRREIESGVVRSGSVNAAIAVSDAVGMMHGQKSQERLVQRPLNSWRKSNGWKRVTSPVATPTGNVSPKKETNPQIPKSPQMPPKALPTRIPTCIPQPQHAAGQQIQHSHHQQQQQPMRKSKIPPPVPVRRSYAS